MKVLNLYSPDKNYLYSFAQFWNQKTDISRWKSFQKITKIAFGTISCLILNHFFPNRSNFVISFG